MESIFILFSATLNNQNKHLLTIFSLFIVNETVILLMTIMINNNDY